MQFLRSANILDIMEKTLGHIEPRLINHGRRVAYTVYRIIKKQGKYTRQQIRDICILAMLHDIGAYKSEEINRMITFETNDVWEHSIYGYLFFKYFSPLSNLAPVILFHHANCKDLEYLDPSYRELTQILCIADRMEMLTQSGMLDEDALSEYYNTFKGTRYLPEAIDIAFAGDERLNFNDSEIDHDREFYGIFYGANFTDEDIDAYLQMITVSIDFRSTYTVTHTIASTSMCSLLADYLSIGSLQAAKLSTAAILHDVGMTGIPEEIIEKPNRLSEDETAVMKGHVEITRDILSGSIDDEIVDIALRHHERLDGSGYPAGLSADSLSPNDRILAVADVFSALYGERSYKSPYPKDKIVEILSEMADKGQLDREIVSTVLKNFDEMIARVNADSRPIINAYEKMHSEYDELMETVSAFGENRSTSHEYIVDEVCKYP